MKNFFMRLPMGEIEGTVKKKTVVSQRRMAFEFALKNRMLRVLLVPVITMIVLSSWAESRIPVFDSMINNGFIEKSTLGFKRGVLGFIAMTLFHYIVGFGYRYIFLSQLHVIKADFQEESMKLHLQSNQNYSSTKGTGELAKMLTQQSQAFVLFLEIFVIEFLYSLFFFVLSLYSILTVSSSWGMFASFILILVFMLLLIAVNLKREITYRSRLNQAESSLFNKMFDILRNSVIIKVFNKEDYEVKSYRSVLEKCVQTGCPYTSLVETFMLGNRLLLFLPKVVASLYFFYGARDSRHDFNSYSTFCNYIFEFKKKILNVRRHILTMNTCITDISSTGIKEFVLEETSKSNEGVECDSILFKDVSLKRGGKVIVSPFSIKLNKGEKIAVTGRNGAGKSTFLQMLMGIEEYEGELFFGSRNVTSLSLKSIRDSISYVPQDNHVMDTTLWENLVYGSKTVDPERIYYLCELCGLHTFFKSLPQGYDTPLKENGIRLSGGQRQMVNFIRAAGRDAPIVLLDEPTSFLDYYSAKKIVSLIDEILKNKIVIFTTHSPEFLSRFDRIINIHDKHLHIYNSYNEFAQFPELLDEI